MARTESSRNLLLQMHDKSTRRSWEIAMSFIIDRRSVTKAMLLIATLGATGSAHAAERRIAGSAAYRERMALPSEAELIVRLLDVTSGDSAPALVAEDTVSPAGQVPIAFEILFDDADVRADGRYALEARISVAGAVLFATREPVQVDVTQAAQSLDLMLVRQGGEGTTIAPEIVGAEWQVEEIAGAELVSGTASTLVLNERGTAGGNGGCNRFFATVTASGSAIAFSEMGSTFMACAEPVMAQEQAYFAALQRVVSYRLEEGKLLLLDEAGDVAVRLGLMA